MFPLNTEKKEAKVSICNRTGKKILSVNVVHKYSNIYKNKGQFKDLNNYDFTPNIIAEYNIGIATTGLDWWMITWVTEDGVTHITCPNNFRNILDILESNLEPISEAIAVLAATIAVVDQEPISKYVAAAAAVTAEIAKSFFNTEKTEGFKEHMLREIDASADNIIFLENNQVIFQSESGNSYTIVKSHVGDALKD